MYALHVYYIYACISADISTDQKLIQFDSS